jgi:hypothetical protein
MPRRVLSVFAFLCSLAGATAFAQDGHPFDDAQGRHGQGHAENHDWYQQLKQPGTGFSCCNGTANGVDGDCRPTRAYLNDDGMWYALLDGRWVPVPPRVVLRQLAPDGRSHICASKSGMIYCFLGGSPKI